MNTLLLAAASLPTTGSLMGLLFWVAIFCVVVWGIYALIQWSGIAIPRPVWIIATCLVCIFLIVLLFRLFGLVV